MSGAFDAGDWLALVLHFMMLSMISFGGVITTTPEIHRWLVDERGWMTDGQFNTSIAIAQAAPGPNMLFVALFGWNVGLNTGSHLAAIAGAVLSVASVLLPSSLCAYFAAGWSQRNRHLRAVQAFKQGMGPIVVALLLSTGWILAVGRTPRWQDAPVWAITVVSALVVWRTRLHLLWLLAAGALFGAFALV